MTQQLTIHESQTCKFNGCASAVSPVSECAVCLKYHITTQVLPDKNYPTDVLAMRTMVNFIDHDWKWRLLQIIRFSLKWMSRLIARPNLYLNAAPCGQNDFHMHLKWPGGLQNLAFLLLLTGLKITLIKIYGRKLPFRFERKLPCFKIQVIFLMTVK